MKKLDDFLVGPQSDELKAPQVSLTFEEGTEYFCEDFDESVPDDDDADCYCE